MLCCMLYFAEILCPLCEERLAEVHMSTGAAVCDQQGDSDTVSVLSLPEMSGSRHVQTRSVETHIYVSVLTLPTCLSLGRYKPGQWKHTFMCQY